MARTFALASAHGPAAHWPISAENSALPGLNAKLVRFLTTGLGLEWDETNEPINFDD